MSGMVPLLESMADRAEPTRLPSPSALRAASERRARRNRIASLVVVAAGLALVLGLGQLWHRQHQPRPVQPVPIVPKVERGLAYLTNHVGDDLTLRPTQPGPEIPVLRSSTLNEVCYGTCSIVRYSWDPDARRLALLTPGDEATSSPGSVLLLDKGRLRKLFDCPGHAAEACDWTKSDLAWSPTGTEIALSADATLYVYDLRHHQLRAFDCGGCSGTAPAWSPDGSWISYVTTNAVYRVSSQGGAPVRVATASSPSAAVWSPDGTRLAVTENGGVFVYGASSGRRIAQFAVAENMMPPTWSPDGHRLAYLRFMGGSDLPVVLVANADGTGEHELHRFSCCSGAGNIAWSPDGTQIAVSMGGIDEVHARWLGTIGVIDARTGALRHHYAGFGPVAWVSSRSR